MHILDILALFFICLTLILVVCAIAFGITIQVADHETKIIKTECYDELNHEINELTCDKEIRCDYFWSWLDDLECKELVNSVGKKKIDEIGFAKYAYNEGKGIEFANSMESEEK